MPSILEDYQFLLDRQKTITGQESDYCRIRRGLTVNECWCFKAATSGGNLACPLPPYVGKPAVPEGPISRHRLTDGPPVPWSPSK